MGDSNDRNRLLAKFGEQVQWINEKEEYFKSAARNARGASYFFRVVAMLAFAAGTLAPFAYPVLPYTEVNVLKGGYAFLVLAGLVIAIDQIFIASRNWIRFAKLELDIRFLRQTLDLQRSLFDMTTPGDAATPDDITKVHAIVEKSTTEVTAILQQEHKSWSTELAEASIRFEQMVKGAIDQAKKDYETRQVKADSEREAQQTGAALIEVKDPEGIADRLTVTVGGGDPREVTQLPTSLAFGEQSPGLRTVQLKWLKGDGTSGGREEYVNIKPGEISRLSVDIPTSSR